MFTTKSNQIFSQAIADYHRFDKVDMPIDNPYKNGSIEYLLYLKNWIDTVQWHLEDIIRDPHIDPEIALKIKRRIDRSNQERTDMVEYIDSYFLDLYKDVPGKCDGQYRESGLGDRPLVDSRAENLSHGAGGGS